jgi:hypothetical protein
MQLLGVWRTGGSSGLRRESSHEEPAPNSVHLVDEGSNDTFCGTVDPAVLIRLHKSWQDWSAADGATTATRSCTTGSWRLSR